MFISGGFNPPLIYMNWKMVKLGEVITIKYGKDHKALASGNIPVFGSGGIMRYAEKAIYDKPSILIPRKGSLNNIFYVDKPFWTVDTMFWSIIDTEKADPHFLFYAICKLDFAGLNVGSAVPSLTVPVIEAIEINLPPLETQRRIAAILSSLDDKIDNNNRINRNLEAQAQALFKSWFVDFEPWGGKMPEDWKERTLGEIAHVTSGKRPPLKQSLCSADINIPLIGAADIMGYTNSVLYTTPILVTGRVGTHGIVQRFNEPCWPSDNTLVVEGKWYEYIYQTMCRIDYHNMNRGSTQPLITQTDLKNQKVIIPNVLILDKFETQVTILYKQVYINQRENDRLAALRDTLLPKLMKGEIEV